MPAMARKSVLLPAPDGPCGVPRLDIEGDAFHQGAAARQREVHPVQAEGARRTGPVAHAFDRGIRTHPGECALEAQEP
jgi:hypothetical protein